MGKSKSSHALLARQGTVAAPPVHLPCICPLSPSLAQGVNPNANANATPIPTLTRTPTPTPAQVDLLHDSGPVDSEGRVLPAPVFWATRGGVNAGGQRTYDVATEPLIQVPGDVGEMWYLHLPIYYLPLTAPPGARQVHQLPRHAPAEVRGDVGEM